MPFGNVVLNDGRSVRVLVRHAFYNITGAGTTDRLWHWDRTGAFLCGVAIVSLSLRAQFGQDAQRFVTQALRAGFVHVDTAQGAARVVYEGVIDRALRSVRQRG